MNAVARRYAPVLTLLMLSPLIGEVLFGAVPLSALPFGLFGLVGLYGGGALLVREIVRGRELSTAWIVLLGLAYGIFEEGPVVQSLFDQHSRGLDFLGYCGHWIGVNWVWALFIVPYHAVFSITIPILLTELIYHNRRADRWLGRSGVVLTVIAFGGNAILLAIFHTGLFTTHPPATSLAANIVALLITGGIVAGALAGAPPRLAPSVGSRGPEPSRRLRLIALVCGLAWFVGFRILIIGTGTLMTASLALVSGAIIAGAIVWAVRYSSSPGSMRSPEEIYALVAGALPSCWLMGFLIAVVSGGNPVLNLSGQVVFGAIMFFSLRKLHLRIRDRARSS